VRRERPAPERLGWREYLFGENDDEYWTVFGSIKYWQCQVILSRSAIRESIFRIFMDFVPLAILLRDFLGQIEPDKLNPPLLFRGMTSACNLCPSTTLFIVI
jgi:hypothetical protein